jgi:protein involved in polysaccharide export with SLBB domain
MAFTRPSFVFLAAVAAAASACSAPKYFPTDAELARFLAAGPVIPEVDESAMLNSLPAPGPYRVVCGDVLEILAPRTFFERSPGQATGGLESGTHAVRVDREGTIEVPLAGELEVRGLTLPEIEEQITAAVYPKYLTQPPSVLASVTDYHRVGVSVLGAVSTPGLHYLRSDRMSLYGALMEAGGIVGSGDIVVGARLIRIYPPDADSEPEPILLPVQGLSIPVADVALQGGERIEVKRYEPDIFTAMGLVQIPGAHVYPPEITYNLLQALGVAGGVDMLAAPPYATIFRKDEDGTIVPATFDIRDHPEQLSRIIIKPGDVISVGHTPGTWTRAFASNVIRINIGWAFNLDDR